MDLGIIGLPQSGKKTIFRILTGMDPAKAMSKHQIRYGTAAVRDPRIDALTAMYKPKRMRYAEFQIALPPDIQPETSRSAEWLEPLRRMDAFLHVVRAFESPDVFHILGSVDAARDFELVQMEFLLADLSMIETRLERLGKNCKPADQARLQREQQFLEKCRDFLEAEKPLSGLTLSESEAELLRNYQFLTVKPTITVLNLSDNEVNQPDVYQSIIEIIKPQTDTVVILSAAMEEEIAELSAEEQADFMEELGMTEPALFRLSQAAYKTLGLISFFTVGPDEVRAWPVRQGAKAPAAGGRIHTDIERGFIRAQTIHYRELLEAGSESIAKQKNLYRLNGKDYTVQDGDVIEFRFSV